VQHKAAKKARANRRGEAKKGTTRRDIDQLSPLLRREAGGVVYTEGGG